jgi:hypothetical protein
MNSITITLDPRDLDHVVVALRLRSNQLHNLADECIQRDPGGKGWVYYRQRGDELHALANRLSGKGQDHRDTDISELISRPTPNPES